MTIYTEGGEERGGEKRRGEERGEDEVTKKNIKHVELNGKYKQHATSTYWDRSNRGRRKRKRERERRREIERGRERRSIGVLTFER